MTPKKLKTKEEFGYYAPPYCTRANVARVGTPLPDDVFVCSYPKSGTNWLKQIVHCICIRGDMEQVKAEESIDLCDLCPYMEADPTADYEKMKRPRCFHTHVRYGDLPQKGRGGRVIYIVRDLPDISKSLHTFVARIAPVPCLPSADMVANGVMDDTSYFGAWDAHVESFWQVRNEPHVHIVKYEDLKKDLQGEIARIAKFLGVDLDAEALARVVKLSSYEWMKANDHRIMGSEYLARITGGAPAKGYTFMGEGKGNCRSSFRPATQKRMDRYWTERMQPLLGAPSYSKFTVQTNGN